MKETKFIVKIECNGITHHQVIEDSDDLEILKAVLVAVEARAFKQVSKTEEVNKTKETFRLKYEECKEHTMKSISDYWNRCSECGAYKPIKP